MGRKGGLGGGLLGRLVLQKSHSNLEAVRISDVGERPLTKPSPSPLSPSFLSLGTGLLRSAPLLTLLATTPAVARNFNFILCFMFFAEEGGV